MTSLPADVLPGTASPRVSCAPDAPRSEGDDAAWLASSYGLVPDPWQVGILRHWLGVRDRQWAAARCGTACARQNGKNGALEARELYGMVALGERILHTAHEVKTARKAFQRLLEFFDNPRQYPELSGMVREIRRTNGQEAIVLTNGGSVEFIARSRGSGRGFSVDVLVCDEAQELDEDAYAALRPTISASANPQVILTGTPPPPGANGEVFLRFRAAALARTDDRLAWDEWSCDDDLTQVDLDSRTEWAARNPALGTRLAEQTVADERAEFDAETFARERLGWWRPEAAAAQTVVDPERWAELADPRGERGESPVFGVDIDEHRTAHITVVTKTVGGTRAEVASDPLPAHALPGRMADLIARWGGQVAAPTVLLDELERAGLSVVEVKSATWPQACGGFLDAVSAGTLRHGNQPRLNEAVSALQWGPTTTSGQRSFSLRDSPGAGQVFALVRALHAAGIDQPADFYSL